MSDRGFMIQYFCAIITYILVYIDQKDADQFAQVDISRNFDIAETNPCGKIYLADQRLENNEYWLANINQIDILTSNWQIIGHYN